MAVHARVAEYRGADPAAVDATLEELTAELDLASPPEGLEGLREIMVLVDRDAGRALVLTLFEDADALRRGDAVLAHRRPSQAGGVRTDVATFEVALRRAAG
jgi:hypothetical protein